MPPPAATQAGARNFSKEQSMLPEDDRGVETCRRVLNVLMLILDFLNNIYIYIYVCVCN